MFAPGSSSQSQPDPYLNRKTALWVILGVALGLTGVGAFDIYQDWGSQGDPLWSTLSENWIPFCAALAIAYGGWWPYRHREGEEDLSMMAKATVLGGGITALLTALVVSIQLFQGVVKPFIIGFQMAAVGSLAGLVIGYKTATVRDAQNTAEREKNRLCRLLDGLPTPVVHGRIDDGALIIKEVNAAFENTFGFEAADLQGQDLNQILVPDGQREEAATLDREALRHGHAEKVVQRQTAGGLRDFQLQLTRAQTGDTREVYAVYTDITRQREQKRKLEQMQEEMELALDHTDSIIFGIGSENQSVGPEDRSVWRRGSFSHFFDASSAEVPTVDAFADHAVHPEDQEKFRRFYHEVVEGGREFGQLEYRTHPQLGDVWWIRDHVHAKDESQRHQVLGLARNVTAQKQREEELRESKEEAEEARQLKSAMLANMSHEIRTPLTSITGFSQILQETLDGKREEFAGKIHQSSQRLMDTIETVLQLSKLEAGVKSLRGEVVALREVVETVEELVRPWVEGESLTLHVETPECPVEGYWSEDAVRRITRNLVENAIKFTEEGGRVEISATKENGEAVLEVEDTGIGISEDAIPEVFHAFKQESEGRDREYEGTGLGLSIVNRLTNELGGDIEVDTEKGEGTCFAVHLPLSPPEKSPTAA